MCATERYPGGKAVAGGAARESGPLRPAFDVLDADRDGRIGRDDLKAFYSSSPGAAAGAASDAVIGSMISAADADRDGYVAFEEFERVLLPSVGGGGGGGGGGGVMEEVFRAMDRDGDGRVGFDDLRGYMEWAGLPATDDDIRAMLRLGGGDDDGDGVCYQGLVNILADSMD